MFNLQTLKQLEADVGTDVLAQLMTVFCNESTQLTEQLMACNTLDDECVRLSHSLKSCARSYGADTLASLAETLETLSKTQSEEFFTQRKQLPAIQSETLAAAPKY